MNTVHALSHQPGLTLKCWNEIEPALSVCRINEKKYATKDIIRRQPRCTPILFASYTLSLTVYELVALHVDWSFQFWNVKWSKFTKKLLLQDTFKSVGR